MDDFKKEDANKRVELIRKFEESIRNVISNLRETIWAIQDESISLRDFSDKLKVYTRSMFSSGSTRIIFSENLEKDVTLKNVNGLQLFRICQEIINNAFKYAKATELSISIVADDNIEIEISDNGTGFDYSPNSTHSETFGLTNIFKRAAEADIEVELNTAPGKGTRYRLTLKNTNEK